MEYIYICIYIIYISCLSIMNNCTIHCNFAVLTVWKMPFIWSNQMNVKTVQRRCHLQLCCRKLLWNTFWKIHRKTPVLGSLFNKVAGLRPLWLYAKRDSSNELWEFFQNYFIPKQLPQNASECPCYDVFNPFQARCTFYTPWKCQRNWVFWSFQRLQTMNTY